MLGQGLWKMWIWQMKPQMATKETNQWQFSLCVEMARARGTLQ